MTPQCLATLTFQGFVVCGERTEWTRKIPYNGIVAYQPWPLWTVAASDSEMTSLIDTIEDLWMYSLPDGRGIPETVTDLSLLNRYVQACDKGGLQSSIYAVSADASAAGETISASSSSFLGYDIVSGAFGYSLVLGDLFGTSSVSSKLQELGKRLNENGLFDDQTSLNEYFQQRELLQQELGLELSDGCFAVGVWKVHDRSKLLSS